MTRCPECNHENILDLPICEQCYAFMTDGPTDQSGDTGSTEINVYPELVWKTPPAWHHTAHHGFLEDDHIALYIEPVQKPVILHVPNELVLGRAVQGNPPGQPRLCLAPYGGLDAGVSRLHALIRRTKRQMEIVDLGSTNGTLVNSTRLTPYVSRPFHSGDQIRLARLWLTIYF